MVRLTIKQIRKIFKRNNLDEEFCLELARLMHLYRNTFNLNTPMRRVRFLAQAVHEVGIKRDGTVRIRENMNYSVTGIKNISSHFRNNPHLAKKYGRIRGKQKANQVAIANIFYADKNRSKRLSLGNTQVGDGWNFRGFGLFQTTGRYNMLVDSLHLQKQVEFNLFNTKGEVFPDLLNSYFGSIMFGMAHWHRTKMYKHKTAKITNIINAGLPMNKKLQRLATAVRIQNKLV